MDLADVAKDQGNHQLAVERYLTCIERTGELGEIRLIAEALEGLARAATAWGHVRAALLLFGAAGTLRERVGIGMVQPIEAELVERDLAALRGAVGDRAATALLTQGGALPLSR